MTDHGKLREAIRDEVTGFPIGSGYYATTIGTSEAGEIADAVLAVLAPVIAAEKAAAWDEGWLAPDESTASDNPYRGAPDGH